jgi:hypothetical protein
MPGGDRTGPAGAGPMTGRAAGYCTGYSAPGYMNPVGGGLGRWGAWGRGRGYRHWYHATGVPGWGRAAQGLPAWGAQRFPYFYGPQPSITPKQEIEMLKAESEGLEQALKEIKKRMEELEKAGSKG